MNSEKSQSKELVIVSASLPTARPEDFLPPISRWTTLGGISLLATFFSLLTLSAVFKYKVTIKAPAIIRPSGELRLAQVARDGVIQSIEVEDNQFVQAGDIITHMDDSQLQSQKRQLQGDIQQGLRQLKQIDTQLEALESRIVSETNRLQRNLASARAALRRAERNYRDLQVTTTAEMSEAEAALDLARDEFIRYQELANTGAISQLQISEKKAALRTAEARLKRVKAVLNPTDADIEIARERVAQVQAEGEINLANINQEKSSLIERKVEIQNQINSNRQELDQVEIELEKSAVRAPESGIIQELRLRNPQQVLEAGETIARITPSDSPLNVKAFVDSRDINQVQVGQEVKIRISACPYTDYGTLDGTVSTISSDVTQLAGNDNNTGIFETNPFMGETTFRVTIKPHDLQIGSGDLKCQIKVGMEGRADIVTSQETLLTLILRKTRLLTEL